MHLRRKRKDGRGSAEDHLFLVTACDSCWGNSHLTPDSLFLLIYQDVPPSEWDVRLNSNDPEAPKDPWLWSDMYVLIYNCLTLEGLTTAQLIGMWCYKLGNFAFLGCSSFSSIPLGATVKLVAIACSSASLFCKECSWTAALPPGYYINVHQNCTLPALMYLNPTIEQTSVFKNTAHSFTMPK